MNEATQKTYDYVINDDSLLRFTKMMIETWRNADLSNTWLKNAHWTLIPGDQLAERILGRMAYCERNPNPPKRWECSVTRLDFEKTDWRLIIEKITQQPQLNQPCREQKQNASPQSADRAHANQRHPRKLTQMRENPNPAVSIVGKSGDMVVCIVAIHMKVTGHEKHQ